jgi:hypothetical protein
MWRNCTGSSPSGYRFPFEGIKNAGIIKGNLKEMLFAIA